jgi:hypothetical protein
MNFELILLGILVLALGFVRRAWIWERRVVLLLFAVAGWACVVGRIRLRRYLAEPADCGEPCRSLDTGCSPITLHLDLKNAVARVDENPYLWYKASLRNTSCATLWINTDFFRRGESLDVDEMGHKGIFFRFWDPEGRELAVAEGQFKWSDGKLHISSGPITASIVLAGRESRPWIPPTRADMEQQREQAWEPAKDGSRGIQFRPYVGEKPSDVIPYVTDTAAYPEIFGKTDDNGALRLESGLEMISQPTKYWPHRAVMKEVHTAKFDGSVWGAEEVKTPRPIAPLPPLGFSLISAFIFRHPGIYRMQLAVDEEIGTIPRFRFQSTHNWCGKILYQIGRILFVSPDMDSRISHIQAASNMVEVKVTP